MSTSARMPTLLRYPIFTVAPTSTNRNTSAATHSFPYFTDSLFCNSLPLSLQPDTDKHNCDQRRKVMDVVRLSSSTTSRKEMLKMIRTFGGIAHMKLLEKNCQQNANAQPDGDPRKIETGYSRNG